MTCFPGTGPLFGEQVTLPADTEVRSPSLAVPGDYGRSSPVLFRKEEREGRLVHGPVGSGRTPDDRALHAPLALRPRAVLGLRGKQDRGAGHVPPACKVSSWPHDSHKAAFASIAEASPRGSRAAEPRGLLSRGAYLGAPAPSWSNSRLASSSMQLSHIVLTAVATVALGRRNCAGDNENNGALSLE